MNEETNFAERCPTGIQGFDKKCEGGLVRNTVNVILGGPGTGKTTFLLQFLWNGVNMFNENGLYLSFEPDIVDIFKDADSFGWDFSGLDSSNMCKFIKFSPKTSLRDMKIELTKLVSRYNIKRIAIDPISVLTSINLEKDEHIRDLIFDLTALLKRLQVTILLANETIGKSEEGIPFDSEYTKIQFIEFLADSLIELYYSGLGGLTDRALRITKMRRTEHTRGPIPFKIKKNGFIVS
ncbi:MAG: RAD55 family ATPase [Nanoarchaeota archaeon]